MAEILVALSILMAAGVFGLYRALRAAQLGGSVLEADREAVSRQLPVRDLR